MTVPAMTAISVQEDGTLPNQLPNQMAPDPKDTAPAILAQSSSSTNAAIEQGAIIVASGS